MFIFIPSAKKLNPKVKKALQNGELTIDEVREIQKEVDIIHQTNQKGFKRAIIIMISVFVMLAALSIPQMENPVILFSTIITGGIMAVIMLLVKWLYVDFIKKQFVKAVHKGYLDFPF